MSPVLLRSTLAFALSALAAPAVAAADFATCFTLTPGLRYSTGDETLTIEKAEFAGQQAIRVQSAGGGVGTAAYYDASGRQLLGQDRYGISAWGGDASRPVMTDTFKPAPTFPQTARPGERASASRSARSAAATSALRPSSGLRPAWALRPRTISEKLPVPPRAPASVPSGRAEGS